MLTTPIVLGLLAAAALFWAVGAYNRLVRLRAEVLKAFSALDNVLAVQPALIEASLPTDLAQPIGAAPPGDAGLDGGPPAPWLRLNAAGEQYARSLANARARPLDREAIAALSSAQQVLDGAWRPAPGHPDNGNGAAAALPEGLRARLARLAEQAVVQAALFDAAVRAYNRAIRQFPALILAHVWGFKPAGTIGAICPGEPAA